MPKAPLRGTGRATVPRAADRRPHIPKCKDFLNRTIALGKNQLPVLRLWDFRAYQVALQVPGKPRATQWTIPGHSQVWWKIWKESIDQPSSAQENHNMITVITVITESQDVSACVTQACSSLIFQISAEKLNPLGRSSLYSCFSSEWFWSEKVKLDLVIIRSIQVEIAIAPNMATSTDSETQGISMSNMCVQHMIKSHSNLSPVFCCGFSARSIWKTVVCGGNLMVSCCHTFCTIFGSPIGIFCRTSAQATATCSSILPCLEKKDVAKPVAKHVAMDLFKGKFAGNPHI